MMTIPTKLVQILCLLIGITLFTTAAHAQNPIDTAVSHLGVGVGVSSYSPSSNDAESSQGIGLAFRWHSSHSGWGPTVGFDWHSTDFNQPLGSVDAPLGSLQFRALMAGYGYTQHIGRFAAAASVNGGYSFNHFSVDAGAAPAFATSRISLLGVHVNNSVVVEPAVSVWCDLFKHVGVGLRAAYFVTRPEEVMTTATGSESRHLNADAFKLSAGLTFGVWNK
jgi:hypothetical protein